MQSSKMFRGDTGLFRAALMLAGFWPKSEGLIFNDKRKDGSRRLKLWVAASVFSASQEQQKVLEQSLREAFGDRIRTMYFSNLKGLCIQLKD